MGNTNSCNEKSCSSNGYIPLPIDTTDVELPNELNDLIELISQHNHDIWAIGRIKQGWSYGKKRDDILKTTPLLVPYNELPESEKDFDRNTATEVIKLVLKLGYELNKKE